MTSREIELRTKGKCFLCLKNLSGDGEEIGEGEWNLFYLQSLCRHLEIKAEKIIGTGKVKVSEGNNRDENLDYEGGGGGGGDVSPAVPLCGRCGSAYLKFSDFFHTKELVEMELENLIRKMKGWMGEVKDQELNVFKTEEDLKVVVELREKIIRRSEAKLLQTKPTVKLTTLKFVDLPRTMPILEDSRRNEVVCDIQAKANTDYDDDDDDIPIPILEIVKVEGEDGVEGNKPNIILDYRSGGGRNSSSVATPATLDIVKIEPVDIELHLPLEMEVEAETEDVNVNLKDKETEEDPSWEPEPEPDTLSSVGSEPNSEDEDEWTPTGPKQRRLATKTKSNEVPSRQRQRYGKLTKFYLRRPDGKVKCKLCPKVYFHRAGWQIHYDSIHLGKRYKCDKCSSNFTQFTSMTKHRKKCEGRRRTPSPVTVPSGSGVVLKVKPRSDTGPIGVFAKYYFKNEEGKYVCALCQKEYALSSGFYAHFRVAHINIRRQCKDCGKTFTQNCTLVKHKITCKGKRKPKPDLKFKCRHCDRGFSTPGWRKEHEERVHAKIKYTCEVCKKSYSYKHCLYRHACRGEPLSVSSSGSKVTASSGRWPSQFATTVNKFNCKFCGKEYPSYVFYRKHARETLMKVQERCMKCLTTFNHTCQYEGHQEKCDAKPVPLDPDGVNYYECLECGNKFTTKAGLEVHRESVHGGAVFRCDLCNKPFTNMSNVRRHKRSCLIANPGGGGLAPVFGEEVPFQPRRQMKRQADGLYWCQQCEGKFDSRAKLNFHVESEHLGVKFQCSKCGKSFTRKGGMQLHRRKHCPYLNKMKRSSRPRKDLDVKDDDNDASAMTEDIDIATDKPDLNDFSKYGIKMVGGKVRCRLCERSFSSKVGFRIHYQYIHAGVAHQYWCPNCSKTFPNKTDLMEHEKEGKCSKVEAEVEVVEQEEKETEICEDVKQS